MNAAMNTPCSLTDLPNDQLGRLLREGALRAWADASEGLTPSERAALEDGVPVRVGPALEGAPSYSFWRDLQDGRVVAAITLEDPSSPSGRASVALGYLDL
jgi:hypothetical protein